MAPAKGRHDECRRETRAKRASRPLLRRMGFVELDIPTRAAGERMEETRVDQASGGTTPVVGSTGTDRPCCVPRMMRSASRLRRGALLSRGPQLAKGMGPGSAAHTATRCTASDTHNQSNYTSARRPPWAMVRLHRGAEFGVVVDLDAGVLVQAEGAEAPAIGGRTAFADAWR